MASQMPQGRDLERLITDLNSKARRDMQEGAVTEAYKANREQIIELLNRALASEWTAFMQYWHHYFMATDIHSAEIKEYFKESAGQELHHIDEIGSRIQLLGGVPVAKPAEVPQLWPATVEYGHDLLSMLQLDLIAERTTIGFYSEIVRLSGNDDITTRVLFEEILREEEDHANDLADLIYAMDASTNQLIDTLHEEAVEAAGESGVQTAGAAGHQRRAA